MSPASINSFCSSAASFWGSLGFILITVFLAVTLVFAVVAGVLAAREKYIMLEKLKNTDASGLRELANGIPSGLLQALAGIIDSLVKAPIWFALFLASVALAWTGAATLDLACKPAASSPKTSTTKTTNTVIEKTIQKPS